MATQSEGDDAAKSKNGETVKPDEKNGTKPTESAVLKEDEKKPEEKVEHEAEEKEDDEESLKDDLEDEDKEGASGNASANIAKKSFLGHVCTVKTLLDDNMLVPENNALSFEYMVSSRLKRERDRCQANPLNYCSIFRAKPSLPIYCRTVAFDGQKTSRPSRRPVRG